MSQKYSQDEAQALVKALKEGNQLAFSIVYKTYAAQTFSLAFKYLLNKELAEDAVQNLFLKLWLKKEEIDETKPINRYLFTMLKNDLLNTLRDSKKNIYLLEDCLSMVLELEDNSQNENLKQEQWHPYSPVLSFFFPHHGCLNILINAIFIKRRQFSVAQFELFAFYYPLNVVIHIFPDAVNYFKVIMRQTLFIGRSVL